MIFIKKICFILLLWTLIMCSILIFLFGTNIGVNLICTGITHRIPGLTFDSVSGHWGNLNISHLAYHIPSGVIKIDEFYLSINLKYILFRQIKIEHLFLKNIFINIKKPKVINNKIKNEQKNETNNIFFKLYPIFCENIVLSNLHITSNNTEIQFQKLNTGLVFQDNLLKILPTCITKGSILNKFYINILNKQSCIKTIRTMFWIKDSVNIKRIFKDMIDDILTMTSKYNIISNFIVTEVQGRDFYIYNNYQNNHFTINFFQIQGFWNRKIAKIKLSVDLPNGYFSGTGNILLNNYYPIHIIANYIKHNNFHNHYSNNQLKQNTENIKLVITGSLVNELCVHCDVINIVSTIHVLLKIKLKHFGIPIDLSIIGKKIPISLLGKRKYILEKFNLRLTGNVCDYRIQMKSELINSEISTAYLSLYAQGDINSCMISKLRLNMLDGYCEMKGIINWGEVISWSNIFIFNNINYFQKYTKCPAKLSGEIITQGFLCSDSWELRISRFSCHGNIKNNEIVCDGSIHIKPDGQLNIPMFFINWGSNILEIQGNIKKDRIFNITVKLKVINCAVFSSKLSGNLYGYCRLNGSTKYPKLLLNIDACSLCWSDKDIYIDNVIIDSNIDCNSLTQSHFFLKVNQIKYKNLLLNQLYIQCKGNLQQHYLNIMMNGNKLFGTMNMVGEFDPKHQIWNSKISKTNITTAMGTWRLMQNILIIYQHASKKIILKSHYWENTCCQLPVSSIFQKKYFRKIGMILRNFNFISLDMTPIKTINVHDARVSCTDLCWVIGHTLPQGSVFFSGSKLSIKFYDDENIFFITTNNITIQTILTQIDVSCNWIMCINNNQNFGKFLITNLHNNMPKISGNVQITNIPLTPFFQSLLQPKKIISGLFNININFSGYLYSPKIYGFIRLTHFKINKPDTLFFIKNGLFQIDFFGDYAVFNGMIDTENEKQLYLDGKISNFYSKKNIFALLNIHGDHVNIYVSPTIHIKISPNLVCRITSEKINVQGSIKIPFAYIKIQEFPKNIVDISSEEILLDNKSTPVSDNSKDLSFFLSSNLTINLGNDVNFNGLGLNSKLRGNLKITYDKNDLTLVGQISMYSGNFEAYGQNLIIKKGQLLFSGPLNQSYLDIEAIRNSNASSNIKDSVTAGIRITGILNDLKLNFFSNSSLLSQQEIASYILGGHNLIFSDIKNTNMITSLLLGVSMNRYGTFINKIGKILKVQDLKLNTRDLGVPSLITLSGYITPNLQVKYGISIFDLLTTVTMRFCIRPQLYLEATSGGHDQTLDLLYQFEF